MAYHSIYVYGIVDGNIKISIQAKGIGNRNDEVYCIAYKDVTAIVSNTPFEEYDPTAENTIAHEDVIQAILKMNLTIAPMRFCTVLKTRADILKLLYSAYLPFKKNILKVRNRLELSVKIFLDVEKLQAEVNGYSELVEQSTTIATELNERLKRVADDAVLEEQITDEMIMNASFLVPKQNITPFYEEIKAFDEKFTDKLKIRISGPTAPYNFVDMPTR
jgi:hypothetical protein